MKVKVGHSSEAGYWEVEMEIVAEHATCKGWKIGIYRTFGSWAHFQVVRIDETGMHIVLKRVSSETEARKIANREWLADMGRAPKMIACGPLAI